MARGAGPAPDPRELERREPLEQELDEGVCVDFDRDVHVRRPAGAAPEVDDRPPAAELGLGLDLDISKRRPEDPGLDDVRDRDRVVDRRPGNP